MYLFEHLVLLSSEPIKKGTEVLELLVEFLEQRIRLFLTAFRNTAKLSLKVKQPDDKTGFIFPTKYLVQCSNVNPSDHSED